MTVLLPASAIHASLSTYESRKAIKRWATPKGVETDWNMSMVDIHPRKTLWMYCPGHAWVNGNDRADWLAKQPSQVACFSEDLKCWEAWDTTCGHKAKDITPSIAWRREAWKEEALDDFPLKGRERAIVSQANIGTVSKAILGKPQRDGVERIWAFPSA